MSNRILKAPLVAITGLLAMAAIPAAAHAGGGYHPHAEPGASRWRRPAPRPRRRVTRSPTASPSTNTGNVTLTNVTLVDDKCQATLVRDPAETDEAFDAGDVWHYTCTVVAPTGPAEVHNVATVTAKWSYKCKPKTGRRRRTTTRSPSRRPRRR